jgi:hypothetical protein
MSLAVRWQRVRVQETAQQAIQAYLVIHDHVASQARFECLKGALAELGEAPNSALEALI